jgi:sec-independent protein translocase protein TatA
MRIGVGEVALLIVLALVLFGAKRLPEVGRAAGSAIREFKSALNEGGSSGAASHKAEAKDDGNA